MSFIRPTSYGEITYEEPTKARDALIFGTIALILAIILGKIYGGINAAVSLASLFAFVAFTFAALHGMKTTLTSNSKQRQKLYFTVLFILFLVFGFMTDQLILQFIGVIGILFLWGNTIYRKVFQRLQKKEQQQQEEEEGEEEELVVQSISKPKKNQYEDQYQVIDGRIVIP
jgi:beta-lactamase regulating signal transducer with metallopeptidase domain